MKSVRREKGRKKERGNPPETSCWKRLWKASFYRLVQDARSDDLKIQPFTTASCNLCPHTADTKEGAHRTSHHMYISSLTHHLYLYPTFPSLHPSNSLSCTPPTALPPQLTLILPSPRPFGSTCSNTLGLTSISYSAHPSQVSTMVAVVVDPVFGFSILMVVPHLGLLLGLAGLAIISVERATMKSESLLVWPQEPRPRMVVSEGLERLKGKGGGKQGEESRTELTGSVVGHVACIGRCSAKEE